MDRRFAFTTLISLLIVVLIAIPLFFFLFPKFAPAFGRGGVDYEYNLASAIGTSSAPIKEVKIIEEVKHVRIPKSLRGIYMTSWIAGEKKLRGRLVDLIDKTEINAVVIDIKDYSGMISYEVQDEKLKVYDAVERRIKDLPEFIKELHEKDIYVIGRISAFQDAHMTKMRKDLAVKNKLGTAVWKDRKGISWIDPGSKEYWDYLVLIGKDAYAQGFDELNFDYIRFPSDGDMKDISYPFSGDKVKTEVLDGFFAYLRESFGTSTAVLSADLFGMTTTNYDDLNIGQSLELALKYFDYVCPMVYPSHYPATFNGWANPSAKPYEVVKFSMSKAVERANTASTSPLKLRPWLQDFTIRGTTYTPEMVRAQITATYDSGLTSWLMWDASNVYTSSVWTKD